jgi:hypothetical protein
MLLFAIATSTSYYLKGRTYKASLDFYVINSSFSESGSEEIHHGKLFPSAEEIEVLGSICKSNELFEQVVQSERLINYYACKSKQEALEILKKNAVITIGKKGKITVNVEDLNNKKAQHIARAMMQFAYQSFTSQSKIIRNNTQQDLVNRINYYTLQKEKILNDHFSGKKISKEILEVPLDSLYNYEVLNNIKTKTGLEFKEILSIISHIKRITEIDSRVFALSDQLNKAEQSIKSLNRNNLIIINDTTPYSKNINFNEHLKEGLKYTLLLNALWMASLLMFKHYKKEIDVFLKAK